MSDKNGKMSNAHRAKQQKERQQMIREAKRYQKEKQAAANKKKSNSYVDINESLNKSPRVKQNRPPVDINSKKKEKPVSKQKMTNKNVKGNVPKPKRVRRLPSDDYKDEFFVDESKEKKAKYERKKREKQKKQKPPISPKRRRIKHIITYCLIFAAVLTIGIILSLTVLFKTEKITVEGNSLYEESKIVELSGVHLEQNIFLAKFASTPDKIINALPYIEEASVNFKIPDTITITVKNAEAAYVIISNNQYYKVSAKGRILEASDQNIENLPILLCPDMKETEVGKYVEFADEKVNKILLEINQCIAANDFEGINFIDVNDTANISMIYDSRIKIIIGLPEDIAYKLKTAMSIITEKLDQNGAVETSGTLDVSKCNSTKKSYFRDGDISLPVSIPGETQPATTEPSTTQAATDGYSDGYSDDYTWQPADDGGYSSSDSGYSSDDGSGYSADNAYGDVTVDPNYSANSSVSDGSGDYAADGSYSSGSGDSGYSDVVA